jgi:hypothetical protein
MPAHHTPTSDTRLAQHAIVHQLLRDDHTERWTPKQLQQAFSDLTPEVITDAVNQLEAAGAVWRLDDHIGASRCARHLFTIDLISI